MKRMRIYSVIMSAVLSLTVLCSCVFNQVTVSFEQEGQETVFVTLEKGGELTDIPKPVEKEGYTVVWDRDDFSNLKSSIVVKAIETPNLYVINYEIENNVQMGSNIQEVRYKEEFTLAVPKLDGFTFKGWRLKDSQTYIENGKYIWTENITLVAEWDLINNNDFSFWY